MQTFAWFAAGVALLALAALALRLFVLVGRLQVLIERVRTLVDADIASVVQAVGHTARGAEQAVGKLDKGLESLASALARVDGIVEKLEPESLARTVAQPAAAKLAAWVSGLRKGLSSVLGRRKAGKGEGGEGPEAEAG